MSQTRRPAGTPSGGQFAPASHCEPTATLVDPTPPTSEDGSAADAAWGWATPEIAERWRHYGLSGAEAQAWTTAGLSEPAEACAWMLQSVTPMTVRAWRTSGFHPAEAGPWTQGFAAAESAAAWKDQGFDADEAMAWRSVVPNPSDARSWNDYGFSPLAAGRWIAAGHTSEEAYLERIHHHRDVPSDRPLAGAS